MPPALPANYELTFYVRADAPDKVNPPEGVKSADWIKTSLKPAK